MTTLSEAASRRLVEGAGVAVSPWATAADAVSAAEAAASLGLPAVVKLCGDAIAHKTERGLVRLGLSSPDEVGSAAGDLLAASRPEDGEVELLIGPMLQGNRELIAGLVRDEQFGPCVMLGLGGILAESVADVSFRLAPLGRGDALDLIDDLGAQSLLGEFRGEPAVDREALADVLLALSRIAEDTRILSVDLNPLIVVEGRPVAVDALVETA